MLILQKSQIISRLVVTVISIIIWICLSVSEYRTEPINDKFIILLFNIFLIVVAYIAILRINVLWREYKTDSNSSFGFYIFLILFGPFLIPNACGPLPSLGLADRSPQGARCCWLSQRADQWKRGQS